MKDIYGFDMQHVRINGESFCSILNDDDQTVVHYAPLPYGIGKFPCSDFEANMRRVVEFFRQL